MLAVQFAEYGGPDVLVLREIDVPQPAANEVLIDVHAASLNPIDWKIRAGLLRAVIPLTLPATVGRDGAGIVSAVGSDVDPSLLNTRVCFFAPRGVGTWAQRIVLPSSCVAPLPDTVSMQDGAALPLAGLSAWIALAETAHIAPGMRVLVHAGAGGVGSFAIQIARARGAYVITTCSARNRDFVTSLGANEVIAYDQAPFESQLRDIDIVFDLLGGDVHKRSYAVLKSGGTMVCLVAAPFEDQSAKFDVKVVVAQIMPKQESLMALVDQVASGALRVPVEKRLPLADFKVAHEQSQTGHMRGKLVVDMQDAAAS
ncbi:NADP-dependent oxidoreductase [Methylocella sp. CPCC 101449]|uniref:NADP-dependent oxidoreductase n=1 Tax=Methylocella sp. CPCC 101449 TaxID=2987531 RepID=UPI002892656C|nr:NADP-dependent oxidoreductase [Methylocella sp. CPCC 101449]MDT2019596.1 NADP-dependent oxidoreductase [Methylocella sp. CPCC 101449]